MKTAMFVVLGMAAGVAAGFTGLGGGFAVVPILVFIGFTPQRAVGTSFLAILIVSLSALFAHNKLDHVDWVTGLLLGAGGLIGAQVGARLLVNVSEPTFNKIFAVVLLALAVRMFLQR